MPDQHNSLPTKLQQLPCAARAPSAASEQHALESEIAELETMDWPTLRQRWVQLTGRPAPKVKHALLRLALAFEMQASVHGGLSPRSADRLADMSAGVPAKPRTTTLVREWKGLRHSVLISEDKTVHWNGRQWRSLSEVARAITGTRWSGPAFFGLKKRSAT